MDIQTSPIVVDIETAGLPNAAYFLEAIPDPVMDDSPIEPAKNLTDPAKIAASIEQRTQARIADHQAALDGVQAKRRTQIERCALDWNVGRIAAIAWWTEESGIVVRFGKDEHSEATMLMEFWRESRHRTIVGFNVKGFDLKFMIQRSRYLGVNHPLLDLGKYTRKGIIDLFSELTFNDGTYDQGAMRRTLHAFCKRFGIPVTDDISGAEIPKLVEAGAWDLVATHVTSDVLLSLALARKLGIIQPAQDMEAVAV